MAQENIFDNIRNEILHCDAPQRDTSTKSKKNKYDTLVEKIVDHAISLDLGFVTNLNFIKGISKAAYNFSMKLEHWTIKNMKENSNLYNYKEIGLFINSPKDLSKRYNLLMAVVDNCPQDINMVLNCIDELSLNKYNNADSIKHVFELCDKIKLADPKLSETVEDTKAVFFERVCSNNPKQGMLAIVDLLEKYPTKEDLSAGYSGILSLLESSNMKKELYPPLIKMLKICNKSGYNTGLVRQKFNRICMDIHAKDKGLNAIELLKDNAHKKQAKPDIEKVRSILKNKENSGTEFTPEQQQSIDQFKNEHEQRFSELQEKYHIDRWYYGRLFVRADLQNKSVAKSNEVSQQVKNTSDGTNKQANTAVNNRNYGRG